MGRIMRNRQEYGGGSSGSGHIITDGDGTSMTQESKLKFVGSNVADDSTHQSTVITNALEVTQAEYDALVQAGEVLPDVDYYIEDAAPTAIDAAHLPYDSNISTKEKIESLTAEDIEYSSTQNVKQKIDEISEIENISNRITLATGFSLKSWGFIKATKIGKMVRITIFGFTSSSQLSIATPVANVSFNISNNDMGVAAVGDDAEKTLACRTRSTDNTIILHDPIPANTNMYLTIECFMG